ncbi:MAG: pseudouridine synthase [Rubrivivax sp.]
MTDPKPSDTAETPPLPAGDAAEAAPKRRRRRTPAAAASDGAPDGASQRLASSDADGPSVAAAERPAREAVGGPTAEAGSSDTGAEPGRRAGAGDSGEETGATEGGAQADGRRKRHRNRRRNRRGRDDAAPAGADAAGVGGASVPLPAPATLPRGDANEWFAAVLSGAYDDDAAAAAVDGTGAGETLPAADALALAEAAPIEPVSTAPTDERVGVETDSETDTGTQEALQASDDGQPAAPSNHGTGTAAAADGRRVLLPDSDAPKLQKVLAQAGVGSRRDLESIIASGRVQVNGQPAHVGQRIKQGDRVTVDGKPVRVRIQPLPARVIAYHKPVGEVVTHDDPQARPTVFRRLPRLPQGKWQSVGRLDINTEGLLLFTNSGDLANRLMHPRFGVEREYAVRVLGSLDDAERQRLLDGVEIDGQAAAFSSITDGGGEGVNRWYRVVIHEGRNREVRRLFESVGKAVSRLIRIRYGVVVLPRGLKRGAWVDMSADDVQALRAVTGMPERPPKAVRAPAGKPTGRNNGRSQEPRGDRQARQGGRDGARERPRDLGAPPVPGDENRRPPRGPQADRPERQGRGRRAGKPEFSQNFGPDGRPLKQSDLHVADFDDGIDADTPVGPIPNPLQQTFDKRAFQQSKRSAREYSDDGPIPNPLQQTYDKRAVAGDRKPKREYGDDGPIPNPLQQTYDKRFASSSQPLGKPAGARKGRGGGGGGGGKGKAGGPAQPDPMRTAVGYIGGDTFMNKLRGAAKGNRGRGGKGR